VAVVDSNGSEILSRAESLALLASRSVGRVALSRRALPLILPVTYEMVGEDVVFAATPGLDAAIVTEQDVIAFEVDDIAPETRHGWVVLIVGMIRQIEGDDPGRGAAAAADRSPRAEATLVRLPTEHLSGRRVGAETATVLPGASGRGSRPPHAPLA
jgi:uncharacterized protein